MCFAREIGRMTQAAESSWWMDFFMFKLSSHQMLSSERIVLINGAHLLLTPGGFEYASWVHPGNMRLLAPLAFFTVESGHRKCLGFSLSLFKMCSTHKLL